MRRERAEARERDSGVLPYFEEHDRRLGLRSSMAGHPSSRSSHPKRPPAIALLASALLLGGCDPGGAEAVFEAEQPIASDRGTILDFAFDGRVLVSPGGPSLEESIDRQLLYTVGQLNGSGGVTSPANARITVETRPTPRRPGGHGHHGGHGPAPDRASEEIGYHVELPVAWPSKDDLPTSYPVRLPLRVDPEGETLLRRTSAGACFDTLSESDIWYDYRPDAAGCSFILPMVDTIATVTPSPRASSGRYPELDRVWEDGSFDVVAVFRKDVEGSSRSDDIGRAAFVEFLAAIQSAIGPEARVRASAPGQHAVIPELATEVTLDRTYPDGRRVQVVVLLTDVVNQPTGAAFLGAHTWFARRFADLTPSADLILYDGHSGLGENIRAIADQTSFVRGKYQILYLNACDSFAYLGDDLTRRRGATTPDDPTGTRNLDVILNAMPASFAGMSEAAMALVVAMLPGAAPRPYEAILFGFDPGRVGFVTGDEDNAYRPSRGLPPAPVLARRGTLDGGRLALRTPVFPAGDSVVQIDRDPTEDGPRGPLTVAIDLGRALTGASSVRCDAASSSLTSAAQCCWIHLDEAAPVVITLAGEPGTPFVVTGFAPRVLPALPVLEVQRPSRQSMK